MAEKITLTYQHSQPVNRLKLEGVITAINRKGGLKTMAVLNNDIRVPLRRKTPCNDSNSKEMVFYPVTLESSQHMWINGKLDKNTYLEEVKIPLGDPFDALQTYLEEQGYETQYEVVEKFKPANFSPQDFCYN